MFEIFFKRWLWILPTSSKYFQETPQNYWGYSTFCKPMRLNRLLPKDVFHYILLHRMGEGQSRRKKRSI